MSREIVLEWIEKRPNENAKGQQTRASAIRCFGSYLDATGIPAYILPDKFVGGNSNFTPYLFNDEELSSLFKAIDDLRPTSRYPFQHLILPVLFRMIYTCGLRPREGRELLHKNIDFETGEILIAETKGHKERIVVMSDDMLRLCQIYEQKLRIFAPESTHFFPSTNDSYLSGTWINNKLKKCWLDANPGQSPDTLPRVRVYDLRNRFASEILNGIIAEYLDDLESTRGCSISTRNHRLKCIRSFYNYAASMEPTTVIFQMDMRKIPFKKSTTSESTPL